MGYRIVIIHALSINISNTCVIAASEPQSHKIYTFFVRLRLGGRNDRQCVNSNIVFAIAILRRILLLHFLFHRIIMYT